jgi:thymidylate synthase
MAIGPCPFWHQFTVYGDNIDLTTVQRSCDTYLGVPFNIAQDALLLKMVAEETGFNPRFFNHSYVNTHVYLGVPPRSDFWTDQQNVRRFQNMFRISERDNFIDLRDWYINNAPPESIGNERKDHVPFILEQLSKEPLKLPSVNLKQGVSLFNAINLPVLDYAEVNGYEPLKWDSKAAMAA